MTIVISGGTGFIGSHLLTLLSSEPHEIILLTRGSARTVMLGRARIRYVRWDARTHGEWTAMVNGADVVINLVGKNVFEQRWNPAVKSEIRDSRLVPTRLLTEAIDRAAVKPKLFVSASAVGYYGNRHDETITEESAGGDDFLADVVRLWEGAAYDAERFGVRVATPRIGLVLEKSGGMIGKMLLPFRLFVGGPIGSGRQFLPWVHMEDVVQGILFPLRQEHFRGVYNLVSPNPVTMREFSAVFGKVLHRPSWFPVPDLALSVLYGEGAKVILSGQKAVPKKLLESGYRFSFPGLEPALRDLLQ